MSASETAASFGSAPLTPATEPALLAWFGDTSFPDGAAEAAPLSQAAFEATYARLVAAAREPGLLPPLVALEAPLAAVRPDAPVPVAVVDVPVAVADPAAARLAAARAFGGAPAAAAAVAAELAPNASTRRAFLAAALLPEQWGRDVAVYRGRDVTYALDERFWVTLAGAARPDAVTLDPGDGVGPRAVALGASVSASYAASVTEATVTLVARYGDATRTARFTLPLGGPPAAPPPDETWPLAAEVPHEAPVSGRASVWHATTPTAARPVVLAEGFPGGYAPDYMYDLLNQGGLADGLRARGHDLVVVHYDAGTDPIQRSARVVMACVAECRGRGAPPFVVGGVSMGGLVARYALAWMERYGVPHGAHTFLTIDTPHLGAYTAAGDQWLAQFLAPVSPLAATLAAALGTPANQQFVMRVVQGARVARSPLRDALLAELHALGEWPRAVRRLAVSSGSGAGAAESAPRPHRRALALDGAPFVELTLHTLPAGGATAEVASGRSAVAAPGVPESLDVTSDVAWDDVPGATNDYTAIAAGIARALGCGDVTCDVPVCCSVPTVSALALDQDPRSPVPPPESRRSPFHDYTCAERDEHHCVITPAVAAWLLDRLSLPNVVRPTPRRDAAMTTTARPAESVYTPPAAPAPLAPPNVHAPAFTEDPYPTYARMRDAAPVTAVESGVPWASYPGVWVTRHEDVKAALLDPDTFRKNPVGGGPPSPGVLGALDALPAGVFSADGPAHDLMRHALEEPLVRVFQGAGVVAGKIADGILSGIVTGGTRRMELMSDYALRVPSGTLFALLGLPQDDWPGLVGMVTAIVAAHDIAQSPGVRRGGAMSNMALTAYCQGTMRRVAASSEPSVLKEILDRALAAGLTADHVQSSLLNLIVAGYVSTTYLIGTGVLNLLANPYQLAALRADPSRIGDAVQEMLRYDAPAQVVDRVTSRDTTIAGTPVPANTVVTLVLGSANRDERVFADPDRFDIARPNVRRDAIPFGVGIHTCVGAPLVGIVAPIAIVRLITALPAFRVDGTVQWQTDPYLRAPVNVPLAI